LLKVALNTIKQTNKAIDYQCLHICLLLCLNPKQLSIFLEFLNMFL
jgi:hypothetical protein